ncbi:MAG: glutamine amidotransferase [Armatimonadota bacterium]
MFSRLHILLLLLLVYVVSVQAAPVSSSESTTPGGAKLVTIENDLYRLTFDPTRGGRCSSFIIKKTNRELVYDGPTAGLFQDHFAHQYYPGELLTASYQYAIEGNGKETVTLRLWTTAGADNLTRGLKVEKSITLRAGRRELTVVNSFTNDTDAGKNVALWVQHCFCLGGDRLFDFYYRPSATGISLDGMDDNGEHKIPKTADAYAQDWVKQPMAGWSAARDRRTNEGIVFLLDYNYLNILYNCAGSDTVEWFMDKVPLPAGKRWSTAQTLIPVDGFTGFSHAGTRVIADTAVTPEGDKTQIAHTLCGTTDPQGLVTVQTRLYGVRSHSETALPDATLPQVGLQPVGAKVTWDKPQTEPLVVRVTLKGRDWSESYEYLYEGKFAGQGIQGAGSVAEYTIPRPKKEKTFLKPDVWTRPKNARLRVMVLYGLYTQHYRVEQAIKALDPNAEIKLYDGWDFFPPTYEELLGYDLLVLSNMPAGPDYANEMVADFARHGGGVLALGGMLTYGSGQWRGTALDSLLPVTIPGEFDLKWEKAGVSPVNDKMNPMTNGVNWPKDARFYWLHDAMPRPGSTVAVRAGKRPLLVLGNCGDGRVAAMLGTCHGEAGSGKQEAWTTDAWVTLLSRTLGWLNGR